MTSVSKRSIDDHIPNSKDLKSTGGIGPGSYSPKSFSKEFAYQNVRAPPFGFQDNKWSPEKMAIKKNIPGPGAYNIGGNMNKGKVVPINPDAGRSYFIQDPGNAQKKVGSQLNATSKDRLYDLNK